MAASSSSASPTASTSPRRPDRARRVAIPAAAFAALTILAAAAGPLRAGTAQVTAPAPKAPSPLREIAIAEDRRSDPEHVIEHALASPEAAVRRRAALAAGRLQDSTRVAALLPLLSDGDADTRRATAFALGQIGHRSARLPLEHVATLPDRETANLAIEALGKIGDHASTPLVTRLLESEAASTRAEAALALWRLADSTALGALVARHDDPEPEVRWKVLYALEKIVKPERVVLVAALHLDDPDVLTRAYAARTIGRQRSSRGTAYLLQKVSDPEPMVVVNALRALQMIGDSTCSSCGPIIATALTNPNPWVRVTAAAALAERFAWVTRDSVRRLGVRDSVAAHLADPDPATRAACARVLLARGARPAELERVHALLEDSAYVVRAAVTRSLSLEGAAAVPRLLEALAHGRHLLERMNAAEALGELRAADALAPLRAGLADTSALYLAACAGALGEMGDTASVPAMAAAFRGHAGDVDADARLALRDALRQLAGAPFADSLDRAYPARVAAVDYPPGFEDPPDVRGAVLHTTAGDIEWSFYTREAPQTVRNFVALAERGYFRGTTFHRVVPNFVIQDGDPTGTGSGGPGYTIRCEYNALRYEAGMVGMALSGKDTGGSQWFITHSPQPHLNGRYTIFARVTHGMDNVLRVAQGDRVLSVDILR